MKKHDHLNQSARHLIMIRQESLENVATRMIEVEFETEEENTECIKNTKGSLLHVENTCSA